MTSSVQTDKTMICSNCRNPNAQGARFCNNCGTTLPTTGQFQDETTLAADNEATLESQSKKDPLIGLTIEGKYRLESLIGAGGMGAVYRATRLLIGDEVAIKILHNERIVDPHASERFSREARAAARLKHPNAVSIYDFGVSSEGLQYLVMELIEGRSLREVTRREGAIDAATAAEVTSQICAALEEAHRQHIVHRDIKPDNIILNSSAAGLRVKVLDFGIAKLRDDTVSHLTQTGSVMGTPHYMSPEQCLGEELDHRADIYSVGIVLYEMLCGRVPFNAPISTAVVVQHVNQPPPPLRSFNPGISPQLERAVLRALEKNREVRPQSATEFAREVTAAVWGQSGKQWSGAAAHRLGNENIVDEATAERQLPGSLPQASRSSREMAATVHLKSISGPIGPPPARGWAGLGGSGSVSILKRPGARRYTLGALAILFFVALIGGVFWWRKTPVPTGSDTPTPAPQLHNATPVSENPARKKPREVSAPETPPNMTLIKGDTFKMGSKGGDQDSTPPHSVTVNSFFMDVHEVTCEEYKKFVDEGHSGPKSWTQGNYPDGAARLPVTGVSWNDANAYARWAGKRLPTEQEWEFAARGPAGFTYPWGDSWQKRCANAARTRKGMVPVGSYSCSSPFDVVDMIGNAWEWTASDWGPYPGGSLQIPARGGEKVIRGGSWESPQQFATGIYRSGLMASGDASGYSTTGFRCAKDLPK